MTDTDMDALRRKLAALSPEQRREVERRLADRQRTATIPRRPRPDGVARFPSAPAQEWMYYLHELNPSAQAYVIPVLATLRGDLDEQAFAEAWHAVVRRHEGLRTRFELDTGLGVVVQVVTPAAEAAGDVVVGRATERQLPRLGDQLVRLPFDLAGGSLARLRLWRTGEDTWHLGLVLHSIIADGWSLDLLVKDLSSAYAALTGGRTPELTPAPVDYADFASWQREQLTGDETAAHLRYWQDRLAGAEPLRVPGDRPEPARRTFAARSVPLPLSADVVAGLARYGRSQDATLFMVVLAAYAYLLHRWSGQPRPLVAMPVAGRTRPELEEVFGFFVNTIPLDVGLEGVTSFGELLAAAREAVVGAFAHAEVPVDRVVAAVPGGGGAQNPLRVLLNLNNTPLRALDLPGVRAEIPQRPHGGTDFDLRLDFTPRDDGGLEGWLVYSTDILGEATATRIAEGVAAALEHVAATGGEIPLAELPVMSAASRETLLRETSGAGVPAYPARTLHDLVAEQVDATPHRTAVVADAEHACPELTYAELDERANRLAHWLAGRGVAAGDRIAICLHRGTDLVVALLGAMKAGAVCVPLDPAHPASRVEEVAQDADPVLVITEQAVAGRFGAHAVADLGALAAELAECSSTRPDVAVTPSDGAYLLYTSGSTGRPKGVVLTHHGVANRMLGMCDALAFTEDDVVLHKSTINADPAMWEILVPLLCGARTVLARPLLGTDPAYLHDVLARHRVTACEFIPSLLRPVLARPGFGAAAASVRVILSAGEVLAPQLATDLLRALPGARFFNCYGPTETTLDITAQPVSLPVPDPVPLGFPVRGTDLHVVDRQLRLQPPGAPGELVVGGAQVGLGYHRRPEQTALAFVPHPFRPGAKVYRTGDLVRWLPDGSLAFLGRIDRQVKVHGYRVEPGEVESALRTSPSVGDAAVVARPDGTGSHVLHAYVTPAAGQRPDADALRRELGTRVPTPMIPVSITVVAEFPLTSSGKVDHHALPEPRPVAAEQPAPTGTPVQEVLHGIWTEAIGTGDVGVRDNFFDLGGNSLQATVVVSRVREIFRIELPLHFFIEAPTIEAMSAMVLAQGAEAGVDTEQVAAVLLQVQAMSEDEVAARLRD
ncbi:amino acid adenylation domain-containing protein [Lentzea sp. NPDC060358]|uniref:non-ribosomal peptide synthetase n=1 Tax=Lentzea sp. NPDC060358 TaxID=3347103 RepID=UPI003668B9C2